MTILSQLSNDELRALGEGNVRMIERAEASVKDFPCLQCADDITRHPDQWRLDLRCIYCRMTLGERIELGTLILSGPEMREKIAAFVREHRMERPQ